MVALQRGTPRSDPFAGILRSWKKLLVKNALPLKFLQLRNDLHLYNWYHSQIKLYHSPKKNNYKWFLICFIQRDCTRNFKWPSVQRSQYSIHNSTLKSVVWWSFCIFKLVIFQLCFVWPKSLIFPKRFYGNAHISVIF